MSLRHSPDTNIEPQHSRCRGLMRKCNGGKGAVFGIQINQRVEIMSSIELPYSFDDEFAEDTDLYKQIYPQHELLGWYSTSSKIENVDMPFHKRFTEYNESPLYLRMYPKVRTDAKAIPVTVYRV